LPFEPRLGDSSAVVVASTLASLSDLQKELSLLPPLSGNDEDAQQGPELPPRPDTCEVLDDCEGDVERKDTTNNDPEIGKIRAATHELRPVLRMLAGSAASEFDLSGSISKILDEQREIRELLKDLDPLILTSTRWQAFKDALQQGLLDPNKIEVSFESFPYYLR
jgi:hypothetical protein